MKAYPTLKQCAVLLVVAFVAILVHGYHPGVEDAEIYLPGIKKTLDPSLYPQNSVFFMSHARMTLFPNLIALAVRVTHLPLAWVIFLCHWLSIFLLLLGCWHLGQLMWARDIGLHDNTDKSGRGTLPTWGGVLLIASLLTIPVAGTALYIMDEYVTTRSFSTPAVVFIIVNAIQRRYARALLWAVFTAFIHPLMVVFGLGFAAVFAWTNRRPAEHLQHASVAAALLPLGLFRPVSGAYREVLNSRPYFFLLRWHWYEWVGIFAPLMLLAYYGRLAKKRDHLILQRLCFALIVYQLVFFAAALVITIPAGLAQYAELQPMRSLHLLYIFFFAITGGLLAESVLRHHLWRWAAVFAPLAFGMGFAQRQLFPATPHIEWAGAEPRNAWVKAFVWVKQNTPKDAYFAIDPEYMALPGEDQHGFRAIAERSRLADEVKDSGAVTMFPALANEWRDQVQAQRGWRNFQTADFARLQRSFGVTWVVLQEDQNAGLNCPYKSQEVAVCRLDSGAGAKVAIAPQMRSD